MKTLFLIFCLSLTLSAMPQTRQRKPANTSPPATAEPDLEETLKWLRETIITSAFLKDETTGTEERAYTDYKVESITFEGCTVKYKSLTSSWWKTDRRITEYTYEVRAKLADLDPQAIRVERPSPTKKKFYVLADTPNKEPKFPAHRENKGTPPTRVGDNLTYQVSFTFGDEEIANRVTKALIHAVKLCSLKKEPF
jgi:hypothetical protein